jgi:CxxC-x17-CxxC domain-containing protein
MGDFKRDGGKLFRGGHSGGFGGRDRGPITMHQAVCDECGKSCEVPFRPSEGKPVYCNVCFGAKRNEGNNRKRDRFSQKNFGSFNASARNEIGNNSGKGSCDDLKKQLVILNEKMDRLIMAVEGSKNLKELVKLQIEKKVAKTVKSSPVVNAKKSIKKSSKNKKR